MEVINWIVRPSTGSLGHGHGTGRVPRIVVKGDGQATPPAYVGFDMTYPSPASTFLLKCRETFYSKVPGDIVQ